MNKDNLDYVSGRISILEELYTSAKIYGIIQLAKSSIEQALDKEKKLLKKLNEKEN